MGDVITICVEPGPKRGELRVNVRGRCTIKIICEMKKNLTEYQRQAIELKL